METAGDVAITATKNGETRLAILHIQHNVATHPPREDIQSELAREVFDTKLARSFARETPDMEISDRSKVGQFLGLARLEQCGTHASSGLYFGRCVDLYRRDGSVQWASQMRKQKKGFYFSKKLIPEGPEIAPTRGAQRVLSLTICALAHSIRAKGGGTLRNGENSSATDLVAHGGLGDPGGFSCQIRGPATSPWPAGSCR